MGDLKPIGSEKLTGQNKINRIMEIARFGEVTKNKEYHTSTNSFNKKGADGNTYSIVKEFDGYYLKCGINESQVDYISGMMNKKKDRFRSYSSALRRMNLIFKPLNEQYNDGNEISMYGDGEIEEQEKFVLNVPDEGGEEEMDVDVDMEGGEEEMDVDMDMEDDMEDEDMDMEDDMEDDMEGEEEEAEMEGFMKPIQKLTGKLGQKLRDVAEELGSSDIKYVINSIISAVELDNLDEEDREEILDRFEDDEAAYGDEEEVEDIEMDDEDLEMDDEDMGMDDEEMGDEDVEVEDEEGIIQMESTRKRIGKKDRRVDTLKQRVGNLLESYIDNKSRRNKKSVAPKKYINSRLNVIKERKNVKGNCDSVEQEISINNFLKKNKSFNFKTKTKTGNIILEGRNKTVIVDKKGIVR